MDDVTVVSYHELSVYSLAVLDHLKGEMMKQNHDPVHCRRIHRVTGGHTHRGDGSQNSEENCHPVHCRRTYRVTGDMHRGDGGQNSEESHYFISVGSSCQVKY